MQPGPGSGGPDGRNWRRSASASEGTVLAKGTTFTAKLVDVSCGGCKIRAGKAEEPVLLEFLANLPHEVILAFAGMRLSGFVVWGTPGLMGCQFSDLITLDEVAQLMSGGASNRSSF